MRIFVAYGYNSRDDWIPTLVFPIIEAFGAEVVTGEKLWGDSIPPRVQERIRQADALVGFATRRGAALPDGTYTTHRWVTDEIAFALALGRPIVEVAEVGVSDQGGIAGDRQRITYDELRRDRCLVEVAQAIGKWCRGIAVDFQLLPQAFIDQVKPVLSRPGFRCTYRLMVNGRESPEQEAKILPIQGGLVMKAADLPRQAFIQIRVQAVGYSWVSDYETLDARGISLRQE
jgi:hypothetical protein